MSTAASSNAGAPQRAATSGYVYMPVGLTFTRISFTYTSHGRPRNRLRNSLAMLSEIRPCARLAPDIA